MAKYSTGGVGGDSGDSCELCGRETSNLRDATVAGARLQVCGNCAEHGEDAADRGGSSTGSGSSGDGRSSEQERRREAARKTATLDDARKGDSTHWEAEGTDYQEDPLPYLVRDYGDRVERARQEAGLQTDELAGELGVDEADVVAVEQGRANRAGIGGSLIHDLEEQLNVELEESS